MYEQSTGGLLDNLIRLLGRRLSNRIATGFCGAVVIFL
jgi:hypothetical protein